MAPQLDTLIIGGPALPFVTSASVRQVPFSFDGLSEAFHLIPECETLIVVPDRSILADFPSVEAFKHFIEDGSLHPIFGELGVIDLSSKPPSNDPVGIQVERIAAELMKCFRQKQMAKFQVGILPVAAEEKTSA